MSSDSRHLLAWRLWILGLTHRFTDVGNVWSKVVDADVELHHLRLGGRDGCRPYSVDLSCGVPCSPAVYPLAEYRRKCYRQCQDIYFQYNYESDKHYGWRTYLFIMPFWSFVLQRPNFHKQIVAITPLFLCLSFCLNTVIIEARAIKRTKIHFDSSPLREIMNTQRWEMLQAFYAGLCFILSRSGHRATNFFNGTFVRVVESVKPRKHILPFVITI